MFNSQKIAMKTFEGIFERVLIWIIGICVTILVLVNIGRCIGEKAIQDAEAYKVGDKIHVIYNNKILYTK